MATPTTPLPRPTTAAEVLREGLATASSESDRIAYAQDLYLLAHPEACSTEADYPNWIPGGGH